MAFNVDGKVGMVTISKEGLYSCRNTSFKETHVCPYCGKEFDTFPDDVPFVFAKKRFCSFPCKNQYRKKHLEEEVQYFSKKECIDQLEIRGIFYSQKDYYALSNKKLQNILIDVLLKEKQFNEKN